MNRPYILKSPTRPTTALVLADGASRGVRAPGQRPALSAAVAERLDVGEVSAQMDIRRVVADIRSPAPRAKVGAKRGFMLQAVESAPQSGIVYEEEAAARSLDHLRETTEAPSHD